MFGLFARRSESCPERTAAAAPLARRQRGAALPADLMRKVRRIEIATNRLVDQGVAGDYHSVFKGLGMEFAEVRPYQPGDEVRTIDWNVTARMGTPFVKKYVEERDLTVFLVVDVSGSLSFGSRAILKRELAAEIAALLSFAALRNQDRVGAALVSDHKSVEGSSFTSTLGTTSRGRRISPSAWSLTRKLTSRERSPPASKRTRRATGSGGPNGSPRSTAVVALQSYMSP